MSSSTTRSRTRKAAALALALVGAAGLSLASASQLNLLGGNQKTVQAGTVALTTATCQTSPIAVTYSLTDGAGVLRQVDSFGFADGVDALTLTKFDDACVGREFQVALGDAGNAQLGDTFVGQVEAGGVVTLPLTGAGAAFGDIDLDDIAQVSVTVL